MRAHTPCIYYHSCTCLWSHDIVQMSNHYPDYTNIHMYMYNHVTYMCPIFSTSDYRWELQHQSCRGTPISRRTHKSLSPGAQLVLPAWYHYSPSWTGQWWKRWDDRPLHIVFLVAEMWRLVSMRQSLCREADQVSPSTHSHDLLSVSVCQCVCAMNTIYCNFTLHIYVHKRWTCAMCVWVCVCCLLYTSDAADE